MAKQKINRRAVIHTVGFSTQNLIKLYNICISSKNFKFIFENGEPLYNVKTNSQVFRF